MKKIFFFFLLGVFSITALPVPASAQDAQATLFLSPGSGIYTVGKTFSVKVMVDSGSSAGINAAQASILYDSSLLTVAAVTKTGSIFQLWTEEPTYSNSQGKIRFGGGSPSPYKGTAGTIISITFNVQNIGEAKVTFSDAMTLEYGPTGKDILGNVGNGKYILKEAVKEEPKEKEKEEPKETAKGILPPTPEISSETHPDIDVWYANNEPVFTWKILADLTALNYSISAIKEEDSGNDPDSIIESYKFEPQPDGEWYFHLKFQNRFGWGQAAHRKLMIDVTPPIAFNITVDNGGDSTEPRPKLKFKTEDETSGIKNYTVMIGEEMLVVSPIDIEKLGFYQPSPIAPGEYRIEVGAVDMAGNIASSSFRYTVDPLRAPIITDIPTIIDKREQLIIRGTSFYPNVSVKVYVKKINVDDPEITTVKTDDSGNWSYFHQGTMAKGNYEVWGKIIDERGAQSLNSGIELLTVVSPSIVDAYGLWIIIILLIIIIGLIFYILYREREYIVEKTRIKKETEEVKSKLSKIFAALREEWDELIELADKKPGLSESERRVKEKMQESLDIAEEFISKEVEDVEKEIKLKKNKV
ncbi:hypothetical protein K8R32_05290 [bacterium]|nr:hypothetical protein [bacterium]